MGVSKGRFLRWMCGDHIRKDKLQNGCIQGYIGVTLIMKRQLKIVSYGLIMYKEGQWRHQRRDCIVFNPKNTGRVKEKDQGH